MRADPTSASRVIVVQNGARHNYGLPSAFAKAGILDAFYTDMCAGRGLGRLSALPMPGRLGQSLKKLNARRPPVEVEGFIKTTDFATAPAEAQLLLRNTTEHRRRLLTKVHRMQGEVMLRWGFGRATHIVNTFGQGGRFVVEARARGLNVLTDMIIAPSTGAIEQAEADLFPDWGPRPAPIPGLDEQGAEAVFKASTVYVCPSQFVADDLASSLGVPRDQLVIIPYGIYESWLDVTRRPQRGRILFVGSAERRKGIHYLAMASQMLRARGKQYEFRVVGQVHELVSSHLAAKELNFVGRVSRTEVSAEFAEADLFVLPSLAEGSATVIYEAMAVGLPVVTTHASGSYVEHETTGLIVPERDPQALADAIERLLEDHILREKVSKNAKARARNFTWSSFAHQWVELVGSANTPRHPE